MGKKQEFLDRLSGVPEEDIWFENNVHIGDRFLFDDCECEEWEAFQNTCVCGAYWVHDIDVVESPAGDYELEIYAVSKNSY